MLPTTVGAWRKWEQDNDQKHYEDNSQNEDDASNQSVYGWKQRLGFTSK